MDLERRIQILRDCDFSKWRKWGRAGTEVPKSIHGFETVLAGLFASVWNLAKGIGDNEEVENIYAVYGILTLDYSRVPFSELDPQDEDFKFFFEYKQMLDELGRGLSAFVDRIHREKYKGSLQWPEYLALASLRERMFQRDYRNEVLAKYGIDLSEPAPHS